MKKKLIPVLLLTLVNTLGFSLLIPVLPVIIRGWSIGDWVFGGLLSLYSICQFWAAPLFGQLSDQYGRRKMLLISHAGTLVSWVLFAILWLFDSVLHIPAAWLVLFLFVTRLIDGITGGNSSVTNAYLSDITTNNQKAVYFGYLSAVMGIGIIVGPAIGAYTLASSWGYLATSFFGIALSFITLLAIYYILPESLLEKAKPKPVDWFKPFKLRSAFIALDDMPIVKNVMVVRVFLAATMAAYTSIMVFFLIDQFGMEEHEIGNFLFFVGGFAMFNQIVMIKPIVRKFGDARAIALSLLLLSAGLVLFPWLNDLWILLVVYYMCNLGFSIIIPTMKGVLTKHTDKSHQGEILGLEESLSALMFGLMPLISTIIYGQIGSLSFLVWAGISVCGLVFLLYRCPGVITKNQLKAPIDVR